MVGEDRLRLKPSSSVLPPDFFLKLFGDVPVLKAADQTTVWRNVSVHFEWISSTEGTPPSTEHTLHLYLALLRELPDKALPRPLSRHDVIRVVESEEPVAFEKEETTVHDV